MAGEEWKHIPEEQENTINNLNPNLGGFFRGSF